MRGLAAGVITVVAALAVAAAWWPSAPPLSSAALPGAAARLPPPAPPAASISAVQAPRQATLAEQVDALVATRDPAKSWAAYMLLHDCATFNRDGDRLVIGDEVALPDGTFTSDFRGMTAAEKRHDAVFCAAMTERMRQSRIDYLAFAAQGGVADAIVEQTWEGPFGDRTALATRPDDPLVREWKARVQDQLARAAEQDADLKVLSYLTTMHMIGNAVIGQDPALAYRYGIAQSMIYTETNGPQNMVTTLYGPDSGMMRAMAERLTAPERAAQLAEARRIADLARARRQQAAAKR